MDIQAKAVTNAVEKWLRRIPILPKMIVTDQGRQFISIHWKGLHDTLRIRLTTIRMHNLQANLVERATKELDRVFRVFCYRRQNKWSKILKHLEYAISHTSRRTTGEIPAGLHGNAADVRPKFLKLRPSKKILRTHEITCEDQQNKTRDIRTNTRDQHPRSTLETKY